MRLTEKVHQLLSEHLREGDLVIDATAGNGHDTLFLAQQVGESGAVIAIDIQASAIESTRNQLITAGIEARVDLHQADHGAQLEALISTHSTTVAAIVFNLGYLPGSDKTIQTQSRHTLKALDASAHLLRPSGLLCVTAYRAHPGGEAEAQSVEDWMREKETEGWDVECHVPPSKNLPPVLWVAIKPTAQQNLIPETNFKSEQN